MLEIVKKIDSQGRVTIPLPFRQKLGLNAEDELAIECDNHIITIKRKYNNCVICGKEIPFNKHVCFDCAYKIYGDA